MKIAFDVIGTLEGGLKPWKMRHLVYLLAKAGHEVYIWSSLPSAAYRLAQTMEKVGVTCTPMSKYSEYEAKEDGRPIMDIAFDDDRSQTYLATKRFIYVYEVPDDIEAFAKTLLEEK